MSRIATVRVTAPANVTVADNADTILDTAALGDDADTVPEIAPVDAAAAAANLVYLRIGAEDLRKAGAKPVNGLVMIDPKSLAVMPGYNARMNAFDADNDANDRGLYLSMKAKGYKSADPMVVRWNPETKKFYIVRGHRRFGAVQRLMTEGMTFPPIPALLEEEGADDVSRLYDLEAGNSGVSLSPMEKSFLAARLVFNREKPRDIAGRWGVTERAINQFLETARQASMSETLRELIETKVTSATLATELASHHGADTAARILVYAANNGTTGAGKKKGKANPADIMAAEIAVTGFASPVGRKHAPGKEAEPAPAATEKPVQPETAPKAPANAGKPQAGQDAPENRETPPPAPIEDNTIIHRVQKAEDVRGGFTLGKGVEADCVYSANGEELLQCANKTVAARVMQLLNAGWFSEQAEDAPKPSGKPAKGFSMLGGTIAKKAEKAEKADARVL